MITVSSAQFQKQFGQFRDLAQQEPVKVTSHGRDSVVLLSAAEYLKLKQNVQAEKEESTTVTKEFKDEVADFMKKHGSTLEALAK